LVGGGGTFFEGGEGGAVGADGIDACEGGGFGFVEFAGEDDLVVGGDEVEHGFAVRGRFEFVVAGHGVGRIGVSVVP
jgi:hypothetical protein